MKPLFVGCLFVPCAFFALACGSWNLKEVADDNEISIKFQHVARFGETKKYLIDIEQVPKIPFLPTAYKLFENKAYYLKTDTIDLGDPIVSFKIPTDSEEVFRNVRVLHPAFNPLARNGFEWKDCTMAEDNVWKVPPYNKEEAGGFLPDFATRNVNCMVREGLQPEEFFAVVLQSKPPTTTPFTKLSFDYRMIEQHTSSNAGSYELTIKNSGQRNIGDLNVFSNFNTGLISIDPDQGKCERLPHYSGPGSSVCYLGGLAVDQETTIRFDVPLTSSFADENRLSWVVDAVITEESGDPLWPANYFSFHPF
jgi:hypothetical protein